MWVDADIKGYSILSEKGSDCAIGIPKGFKKHIHRIKHDEYFSAVQIFNVAFVSLHLPHSTKPDSEYHNVVDKIMALIHSWKSMRKTPVRNFVVGGDFNLTLPKNCFPISGNHVLERMPKSKVRLDTLLDLLSAAGVRAMNTFDPDVWDDTQMKTWQNKRGHRSQIDYICAPQEFVGTACVETSWKIKSDHWPVAARCQLAERWVVTAAQLPSWTGWAPVDEAEKVKFQTACLEKCGVSCTGKFPGSLTMDGVEGAVRDNVQQISFSTARGRYHASRQTPQEVLEAKHRWKSEWDQLRRKTLRETYFKIRRAWKRQKVKDQLSKLAASQRRPGSQVNTLQVEGEETSCRSDWQTVAFQSCSDKYKDANNTSAEQEERLQKATVVARNAVLDGLPPPELDISTVLSTRAQLRCGACGDSDLLVPEVWKSLPLVMVLVIWQLFRDRIIKGRGAVSSFWKRIRLIGIPKVHKPLTLEEFRFISLTPSLQKWYLRCVMEMIGRTARKSPLHMYGFRKQCCTALVTEVLRQSLHNANLWGKHLFIISCDIKMAFDAIKHEAIYEALNKQGVHPILAKAILMEYTHLEANVTIADAPPTPYFSFSQGGRQGGVETPALFNIILESVLAELIASWTSRKFGFALDGAHYITHCIWADNFFLLADSAEEAQLMMVELSEVIYRHDFRWKPNSLECLSNADVKEPLDFDFVSPAGEELHVRAVDELTALGVHLDRNGSTACSVTHRMAQADKSFYKHLRVLRDVRGGIEKRLRSFHNAVGQTLVYNSGGWHVTKHLLARLRAWENNKFRIMFGLKRAPEESREEHMKRISARLTAWHSKFKLLRTHERVLNAVHRWAGKICSFKLPNGEQPLWCLLQSRCLRHWNDTHEALNLLDPRNVTGWRHAKPGKPPTSWEQALVLAHGVDWWDAVQQHPEEWRFARTAFITKVCGIWGFKCLAAGVASDPSRQVITTSAKLSMPAWTLDDFSWEFPNLSFEFRVDNLPLAQWFSGQAAIRPETEDDGVKRMFKQLTSLILEDGWRLRWAHSDWVRWFPRERNSSADALANLAMDRQISFTWQAGVKLDAADTNYVITSDGAHRKSSNMAAFGWAVFGMQGSHVFLYAAGGRLLPLGTNSFVAERRGLAASIEAFRELANGRGDLGYEVALKFQELPEELFTCLQ